MSIKRLELEYAVVTEQYHEMLENLKDLENELADGLIAPEFVDNLKKQIEPIKNNYEQWSYIMFLLHEPQRKAKREKYRKIMDAKIKQLNTKNSPEARLEEGKEALNGLKEIR